MKMQLYHTSDSYFFYVKAKKVNFNMEDIVDLKIKKRYDIISFVSYLLLVLGIFVLISYLYDVYLMLFLTVISILVLCFIDIIYHPIHTITLILNSGNYSFETNDKKAIQDFLNLQYLYSEIHLLSNL